MMNDFDQKAAGWDLNPQHLERSRAIADLLVRAIHMDRDMTAMEYGAGTGMLSILLKDRLGKITLMDSSEGMIRVLREKISAEKITNLKPVVFDLESDMYEGTFDMIYSQMVFHHVRNISSLLHKFNALLNPDGFMAIADLYPEDGSFHDPGFKGHKGFDPKWMSFQLSSTGFRNINYQTCYTMKKDLGEGKTKEYPVFLMTAFK